ncbi:Helix-turn-helix domain-containing protein [Clostridium amylolyticum]|uniref:Helix-turn-helix domain-containing protein n=1 Tax=Clostridium amylolyticum TaxID=1121298 RepID=A0A1M6MSF8_9CLOT|nr:transcriptional regulator [Clostridium amylolyticum]SHJ86401.1 Helix-turn-helix domain-containing protein [Clostridium amylolyticum]
MEILSTGEKIKRARIYKGITLKELCEDKISISKMSCIENGKVKAEDWILKEVSNKLNIDIQYLKQDVYEQIESNIEKLKVSKNQEEIENDILYSLDFAIQYEFYDLAFELMHLLFINYLSRDKYESIQVKISEYHNFLQKSWSTDRTLIYCSDVARYFYVNEEYSEALIYYDKIRTHLAENLQKDKQGIAVATFNVASCYLMLKKYDMAMKLINDNMKLIDYLKSEEKKGAVYEMLAVLNARLNNDKFEEYEKKALKLFKDNPKSKAKSYLRFADAMFRCGEKDKALEYIKEGLEILPNEQDKLSAIFHISCVEKLVENDCYEYAEKISETALDKAIKCNDIKYIEKAYYLKSLILQKQGQYSQSEMYMNLSLDALLKFGGKEDRYKRYLDMGSMYYELGESRDALKYFMLALSEEKKM